VLFGISLVSKKAAYAALFFMERTGIEPVTSGLQILSSVGQPWSSCVDVRRLRVWRPSHVSRGADDGQSDLTQI
jgi:hypothetical protein